MSVSPPIVVKFVRKTSIDDVLDSAVNVGVAAFLIRLVFRGGKRVR